MCEIFWLIYAWQCLDQFTVKLWTDCFYRGKYMNMYLEYINDFCMSVYFPSLCLFLHTQPVQSLNTDILGYAKYS